METTPEQTSLGSAAERSFGLKVREMRVRDGLTQKALAEHMSLLGCPMRQTMVAKIERGDRPTPVGEVACLASIFGVSPSALFEGAGLSTRAMSLIEMRARVNKTSERIDAVGAQISEMQSSLRLLLGSLVSEIRLHDKTLEVILSDDEPETLTAEGVDPRPLLESDPRLADVLKRNIPIADVSKRNVEFDESFFSESALIGLLGEEGYRGFYSEEA